MQFESTQYDSHELVFGVQGDGEPLVLVPGHTMSIQRWIDAGYVDRLAQNRQVIALDPLGHGRSSPSDQPEEYTSAKLVDHFLAVLDAVGVETAGARG